MGTNCQILPLSSEEQAAFIHGRSIHDNVTIATGFD
ncbi:hypothetical protein COLO4_10214 [Corchorus olitorius]|uniref:Uncharacterized protein n=1 Tax=Corchorus olitorius TaxID=93759 RepID=A0A1R3K9S0_9ROSI|nr:hypothetical protein COLO4_10214 [Corchorus olitorius]